MASFTKQGKMWRAHVYCHGQRKSKVCPTLKDAEAWAEFTERTIKSMRSRFTSYGGVTDIGVPTSAPASVLRAQGLVPHNQSEILMASIPHPQSSGVYFLIRGPEITYVGQAVDVLYRIARHRREGRRFDSFAYISCPAEQLDELEALYIRAFVPEENWSLGTRRKGRGRSDKVGHNLPSHP